MANRECKCSQYIQSMFPITLADIIQAYSHTAITEHFYRSKLEDYNLCLYLNRGCNIVERSNGEIKNNPSNYSIFLEICERLDMKCNISEWFHLSFEVENKSYFFGKCLSANVANVADEEDIPLVITSNYCTFYTNLMAICQSNNIDTLLAEITATCQVSPTKLHLQLVLDRMLLYVESLLTPQDFYIAIHA
jgi:hypothetical protein